MTSAAVDISVCLTPAEREAMFKRDVIEGMTGSPRSIPSKYLYDSRGSELFDRITRLPEYYLTRREKLILEAHAAGIVSSSGADTVIELGSGTSEKMLLLLDAFHSMGRLSTFIPFDVDESTVRKAASQISSRYEGAAVRAVVGDFERHLDQIPRGGTRLIAFIGSTIGNLDAEHRLDLLSTLARVLDAGEHLLLGIDLVKDPRVIEAAYNDAQGVTAEFNRNILGVLNRAFHSNFDPKAFDHVAEWDPVNERVDIGLRARLPHTVQIPDIGLTVDLEDGELIQTEISCKFLRSGVEAELASAGFDVREWWSDPNNDFAVSLASRR